MEEKTPTVAKLRFPIKLGILFFHHEVSIHPFVLTSLALLRCIRYSLQRTLFDGECNPHSPLSYRLIHSTNPSLQNMKELEVTRYLCQGNWSSHQQAIFLFVPDYRKSRVIETSR